ncbi:MAG: type II secretion system GspH family protein [Patescibacteria group bacterium]|nr:type II secretion system GspH family protein [Patescibacteria group bacterium]
MVNNYLNKNKGFSLIEIMVSLAVFSIVVLVAAGALLSIISGAKKTQALKSVINNLNFAMEDMSRNLRIGKDYVVDPDGKGVAFSNGYESVTSKYIFNEAQNRIEFEKVKGASIAIPITAPEVKITNVEFVSTGTTPGDSLQPKIFMIIQGYAGLDKLKNQTNFNLQTTITQRALDF